jgi:hypothetical protein
MVEGTVAIYCEVRRCWRALAASVAVTAPSIARRVHTRGRGSHVRFSWAGFASREKAGVAKNPAAARLVTGR